MGSDTVSPPHWSASVDLSPQNSPHIAPAHNFVDFFSLSRQPSDQPAVCSVVCLMQLFPSHSPTSPFHPPFSLLCLSSYPLTSHCRTLFLGQGSPTIHPSLWITPVPQFYIWLNLFRTVPLTFCTPPPGVWGAYFYLFW